MHQMHFLCAAHDGISDPRDDVAIDTVKHAVLQNLVAFMAVNTAEKDKIGLCQMAIHVVRGQAVNIHRIENVISHIQAMLTDQLFKSLEFVVNDDRLFLRKVFAVPPMSARRPGSDHSEVHCKAEQHRKDGRQLAQQQGENDIHQRIRNHRRQALRIDEF